MPFYWVGALVSVALLTTVITIFGLLLKVGSNAATELRVSISSRSHRRHPELG